MQKILQLNNIEKETVKEIILSEPDECPICGAKRSSRFLSGHYKYYSSSLSVAFVSCFCGDCEMAFLAMYDINTQQLMSAEPKGFIKVSFSDGIVNLSPNFVKIYNQAAEAESKNLDEIAGMGYRKAIEFLVKDFAISENPDNKEKISKMPLSQCINTYLYDPTVKNLAEKAAWIGNDETHYVRKHTDKDISDLKVFIKAAVYFLNMLLVAKAAAELQ